MEIKKCPQCGMDMNESTGTCPNCGCILDTQTKKRVSWKIIVPIIILVLVISIVFCVLYVSGRQLSPMESKVNECFQKLKEEKGEDIKITDAWVYKRTSNEGEIYYNTLIVYQNSYIEDYAGFDGDNEYIGNGYLYDDYDENDYEDILAHGEEIFNDSTVKLMIYEYNNYVEGSDSVLYTFLDYEDILSEEDAMDDNVEHCAIHVDVKKIR